MTITNRQENTNDDIIQKNAPSKTAEELIPATVTFAQPPMTSVATIAQISPDTSSAGQPNAKGLRSRRRIATIIGGICGLVLLCATIVLTIGARQGQEIPVRLSHESQEPQIAASSVQTIDAQPVPIVEPPALEDWLKDRTIITVAQDGSGQFKSIQEALNNLQSGQVVEVLDPGPYRERLSLAAPPVDVGLISRMQTRVEFADSEFGSMGDLLAGHVLHGLNQFRIHGFEFVIPDNPQGGKRVIACFHIGDSKGVVFENCAVHRTSTDSYMIFGNGNLAAVPPHAIRECDLETFVQGWSHQRESEIMILRNHFSVGLVLYDLYNLCVVRNNIFSRSHFDSHVFKSDTYDCSNNTFLNKRVAICCDTREMARDYERHQQLFRGEKDFQLPTEGRAPTGHGVIFNNLQSRYGFLKIVGGGERDPWPWEIAYNCYPGDGNIPSENALPRPANTLGIPILYSVVPQQPNFARLKPDSPGAKSGAGGAWPSFAGALPPGPAPKEGDWFTRLQSRWISRSTIKSNGAIEPGSASDSLLAFQKPEFDNWMVEVAELPPVILVDRVTRKLVELNPGFDGKVEIPVEDGVVRRCKFHTDNITDISPLRALRHLTTLVATGSRRIRPWDHLTGTGKLVDLSPVKGMSLIDVELFNNPLLDDISPLAGMPLKNLHCEQTNIADLTPLKGMKLEATSWSNTQITDLSVFRGMPVKFLTIEFTGVSDLSPLAGMPLTFLATGLTSIKDLAPLEGMPLEYFNCNSTAVNDLSPLSHSRLGRLSFSDTRISDLSPLRRLPLKELNMPGTQVTDVSPLQSMELESLMFDAIKIVKGMDGMRRMRSLKTVGIGWSQMWPKEEFWKKYDASEFGTPPATEITPEVAASDQDRISPYPIQEPLPLQDWLKGRTVLTVAQDGSGQFKTIQEALNALQTGQVVKVLDKGPYQERLKLSEPPADVGLFSEVQTIIELPEFTQGSDIVDDGHFFNKANQLRVHGIEFVFPKVEQGRHARAIVFWEPEGLVFENCAVRRLSDGSFTTFGAMRGEPERPNVIRDCYIQNILQAYTSGENGSLLVLRNYLAGEHALAIDAKFKLCAVRHNIFAPTVKIALIQNVLLADWFDFSNNTILSFPETIVMDTKSALVTFEKWDKVRKGVNDAGPPIDRGHAPAGAGAIYNNLHSRAGFLNVTGGGELEPWSWKIGFNVYPANGPIPAQNAMNQASNTMATPMFYSIWTKDADFARLKPDSPGATSMAGDGWPNYAGALPPGPVPKEGDWFTRLRERWIK